MRSLRLLISHLDVKILFLADYNTLRHIGSNLWSFLQGWNKRENIKPNLFFPLKEKRFLQILEYFGFLLIILIMSRFVEISPIPQATIVAKVREVFSAFSLKKVAVVNGRAYLEFQDANDIETLDFTFTDAKVEQLGGADINPLPEDFQFPQANQSQVHITKQKDEGWQPITESEVPKQKIQKPIFLVIRQCDADEVREISREQIKEKIFGKFKTGRVTKWNRDVYVEFFDENEIETLDYHFPKLNVALLGSTSYIDRVDENFSFEIIEEEVVKHEQKQREKTEAKKRQEQKERKAAQMEAIMRKKSQDEERERIAQQQIQKRKEQEERRQRQKAEQREEMAKIQQKKIQEYLEKKKEDLKQFTEEKTQQTSQAIKDLNEKKNGKISPKSLALFWGAVILVWGTYVIFM